MKYIGRGWQYEVYDLGNKRVLKKRYEGLTQFLKIFTYLIFIKGNTSISHAKSEQRRVTMAAEFSETYIKELSTQDKLDILGNPHFYTGGSYEQDYVIPLEKILEKNSSEENKKLLTDYVTLVKETWRYGFADTVFKFHINNGLRKDGTLTQLDFGEITTDKEKVEDMIQKKRWLQSSSYKRLFSENLQDYYKELMECELTENELEKWWQTKQSL